MADIGEVLGRIKTRLDAGKKAGVYLTNKQALQVKEIYGNWNPDVEYLKPENGILRILDEGELYELRQNHTSQAGWSPHLTPALWKKVVVDHAGTIDDPIPYSNGLEIFNGKYYTQNDVLYLCMRDSGTPLYHDLSALVGIYVEVVTSNE